MAKTGITEKVKQFIFEHVDSVELLEVLLFVRARKDQAWSPEHIAQDMRSSANSVMNRLAALNRMGIVKQGSNSPTVYQYNEGSTEFEEVLQELTDTYKLKKQKILELIFSPLKRGRHFANAFVVNPTKEEGEDDDG